MINRKTILPLLLAYAIGFACLFFATELKSQQLGQESFLGNEDELASEMAALIKKVSQKRAGNGIVKRFNQAKSLGCFSGHFTVLPDLPQNLQTGVFAEPQRFPAFMRFANASTTDDGDKDLRGLSIRVSDVRGDTVWGDPGIQDFVLNSYPVLFASSPEEFMQFIQAQYDDSMIGFFLNPFDSHLRALFILLKARDKPNSPFDIRYWSTTAFRHGSDTPAVKYSVKPCSSYQSEEPERYSHNYLRAAMQKHLQNAPVCFDFMVQAQVDPIEMPIEDPSQEWDEDLSPFIPVARIEFSDQEFIGKEALDACELVTFNPWQALPEHKPLGRMNYVRRQIYAELAGFRRYMNSDKNN